MPTGGPAHPPRGRATQVCRNRVGRVQRLSDRRIMYLRLVPATAEDQPWLEQLRRSVYQELFVATWGHWDEARHQRHWAECWDCGNIYAVEVNGERVGMVQIFERVDALEVGEIQIQPSHQSQGIGTRLLRATLARAHAKGKKVSLSTGLQNQRAVKLYERLGFRHVSQSKTHFHMESRPEAYGSPG
jgi:ribosomal protein S18 acetylase RimI-like enzyme